MHKSLLASSCITGVVWAGIMPQAAQAISLTLQPSNSTIAPTQSLTVDIEVNNLGNLAAPSVSAFDLDVAFNPAVLSFNSATFGDPILGDQLDFSNLALTSVTPASGTINLAEVSFDLPGTLEVNQPSSFTLARLLFTGVAAGSSNLSLTVNDLVAADGISVLTPTTVTGTSIDVDSAAAIPSPSLLGAMLGFAIATVRKTKARRAQQLPRTV